MLALYLTNLASESLFYQLRNRGYVKSLPHGQTIVFSIGLALLFYFRSKGISSDMHTILHYTHQLGKGEKLKQHWTQPLWFNDALNKIRTSFGKSGHCEHEHSCVSNVVEVRIFSFVWSLGEWEFSYIKRV